MTETPEEQCQANGGHWNEDLQQCQKPSFPTRSSEPQSLLEEQPENNVEAKDEEVKKEEN